MKNNNSTLDCSINIILVLKLLSVIDTVSSHWSIIIIESFHVIIVVTVLKFIEVLFILKFELIIISIISFNK